MDTTRHSSSGYAAGIRPAAADDFEQIVGLDHVAARDPARRAFILRAIAGECCHVRLVEGRVVAYAVIEYTFFGKGFVSMLYVAPDQRRRGFGGELMHHMEQACTTSKLFTSTNQSNAAMRRLLVKLGYQSSGMIENLDHGDPELVFFKMLERGR